MAIPRRHAFRPLRVQTFDTSPKCKMKFGGIVTRSESAVPPDHPVEPCPVPETNDDGAKLLRRINAVSQNTLRSCMQTVFEDGLRRDGRLWSGDLCLQALTNYVWGRRPRQAVPAVPREDGLLPAYVSEKPRLSYRLHSSTTTYSLSQLLMIIARQREITTRDASCGRRFSAAQRRHWHISGKRVFSRVELGAGEVPGLGQGARPRCRHVWSRYPGHRRLGWHLMGSWAQRRAKQRF